jgi:diadenosine tetraphosphate (Ap4A) HIT family hydrolase
MSEPCIFCAIAAHKAPASIVYEDDLTIAFIDPRQFHPGHTLKTSAQLLRSHHTSSKTLS